jgi:hypothetical protein
VVEVPTAAPIIAAALSAIRARARRGTVPSLPHEAAAMGERDQRPGVVEQVDEQEGETPPSPGRPSARREVHLQEHRGDRGRRVEDAAELLLPAMIDTMVTTRMPMITPPSTLRCSSATISAKPRVAISTGQLSRLPWRTMVAGSADHDAGVLERDQRQEQADAGGDRHLERLGMALTIHSRIGSTLMMKKMMPEMKTQPSATCQLNFICRPRTKAK